MDRRFRETRLMLTSAPKDYDYGHTVEVLPYAGTFSRTAKLRLVEVRPWDAVDHFADYQAGRYASGMNVTMRCEEFWYWVGEGEVENPHAAVPTVSKGQRPVHPGWHFINVEDDFFEVRITCPYCSGWFDAEMSIEGFDMDTERYPAEATVQEMVDKVWGDDGGARCRCHD